jgi:hypothetical protein
MVNGRFSPVGKPEVFVYTCLNFFQLYGCGINAVNPAPVLGLLAEDRLSPADQRRRGFWRRVRSSKISFDSQSGEASE